MADRRVVLFGEEPGKGDLSHRPELALTGDAGHRLAKYAGLEWSQYLRRTDRRNVFMQAHDTWPGVVAARDAVADQDFTDRQVLLLGSKVADAFDLGHVELYRWQDLRGGRAAVIPHPSGRNRFLNSSDQQARLRRFLQLVFG